MDIDVIELRNGDVLVLLPTERLDSGSARAFELVIMEHVTKGRSRIVVDCNRLEFVASSGLRVLVLAARELKKRNGMLALCGIKKHVEKVLRTSGLHRIIPIETSRDAALDIVDPPPAAHG